MNKLLWMGLIFILCPALISQADMMVLKETPSTQLQPIVIKSQDVNQRQKVDFANPVSSQKTKKHIWKINEEKVDVTSSTGTNLNIDKRKSTSKYASFLAATSPEYMVNRNFLSLQKVNVNRRKQSIMFVFLMNQDKIKDKDAQVQKVHDSRTRMHVMWPGSKKIKMEQQVIDDEYPVDISIANYEDGYAAREWNFVLPNKKPKEVAISLMWTF